MPAIRPDVWTKIKQFKSASSDTSHVAWNNVTVTLSIKKEAFGVSFELKKRGPRSIGGSFSKRFRKSWFKKSQEDKKVCRLFIDIVENKQYSITKREDLENFPVYVLRSRISSVKRCSDEFLGQLCRTHWSRLCQVS